MEALICSCLGVGSGAVAPQWPSLVSPRVRSFSFIVLRVDLATHIQRRGTSQGHGHYVFLTETSPRIIAAALKVHLFLFACLLCANKCKYHRCCYESFTSGRPRVHCAKHDSLLNVELVNNELSLL